MYYDSDNPSRDSRVQVSKVLGALKLYILETKDKIRLLHGVMIGWARLKPIQQETPYHRALRWAFPTICEE